MKTKLNWLIALTFLALALFMLYEMNYDIFDYVIKKRFEKVFAMLIVGSAIGLSTLTFQTITNNRILTPGVLGLDALYIMFQLLIVIFLGSINVINQNIYMNFICSALLLTGMSLLIYKRLFSTARSTYFMVLMGVVMGTFFSSVNSMLQVIMSPDTFNMVLSKLFANFSLINQELVIMSTVLLMVIAYLIYRKRHVLDVLSLGREHSINLGIDYQKEVTHLLVMIFLLVSISTALVGPITFLGFFSVNIVKNYLKTYHHSILMLGTCLVSFVVLLIGQFFVEHIFNFGLPVSVLISLIGGTYFIGILLKENSR